MHVLARGVPLAALVLLVSAVSSQRTIWVDARNPNCPGTGTPADPFCRIQAGLDAAQPGDTVVVADGAYVGAGNTWLSFGGKAVHLRSEHGPQCCAIDMQGSGLAFWMVADEPRGTIIEGFTIKNGSNGSGGAVFCHHDSRPTFLDCVFTGNRGSCGGAVNCDTTAGPLFLRCTFAGNSAQLGGGLYFAVGSGAGAALIDCTIAGNTAVLDGGGLHAAGLSDPLLVNCTIADNAAGRAGGGISSDATAGTVLTNSIVWANAGGQIAGPASVTFCDVQGGHAGMGNIAADPFFVDAASRDYHLRATSPCIGAGTRAAALPATDFEGDPRDAFGQVDIGADEHFQHLYHTGIATPRSTIQLRFLGRPQEGAFWLIAASTIDPGLSIPGLLGLLRLAPASLLAFSVGVLPADGVLVRSLTIPANVPPARVPTQALIGLQFTNLDTIVVR